MMARGLVVLRRLCHWIAERHAQTLPCPPMYLYISLHHSKTTDIAHYARQCKRCRPPDNLQPGARVATLVRSRCPEAARSRNKKDRIEIAAGRHTPRAGPGAGRNAKNRFCAVATKRETRDEVARRAEMVKNQHGRAREGREQDGAWSVFVYAYLPCRPLASSCPAPVALSLESPLFALGLALFRQQ